MNKLADAAFNSTDAPPQPVDIPMASNRWDRQRGYGVVLGGIRILLPIGVFCEFVSQPKLTSLPNSPNYFLGLMNLRGNLAPVYDINRFIDDDRSAPAAQARQVIILGKGDDCAALLCDAPPRTFDLTYVAFNKDFTAAPESIHNLLTRRFMIDGVPWFELDFRSTFKQLAAQ